MRKIFLSLGILCSLAATAQKDDDDDAGIAIVNTSREFSYELSDPYQVIDAPSKIYFGYKGGLTALKLNKEGLHVQYFSGEKLNEQHSKLITLPKNAVYEDDLQSGGTGYFFYSVWDKPNTTEQLFVQRINLADGTTDGEGERLIAVKGKVTGGDGNKFKFEESFDHSTYLIWYRKTPESRNDKKNNDVIGMAVLDKNLKQLWSADEKMPYTEARMNNLDYAVDGKGNAFILTEVMNEGAKKRYDKEGNPNYGIELLTVTGNGSNNSSTDMNSEGKFILDGGFFEGPNESLILAGYYSNKRKAIIDGAFIATLDKNGAQQGFKTYEIPGEVLKQYMTERQQRKIDKKEDKDDDEDNLGFANLRLRDLYLDKNGAIYLAGEQYYVTTSYNAQTKTTTYHHYYKDMLLIKIDADGSLGYMRKLAKNQYASTSGGGSIGFGVSFGYGSYYRGDLGYKLLVTDDYVYLAYMDNVKNLDIEQNQVPKRHVSYRGGFLTAYQVSKKDGGVKKLSILDVRDAKGQQLYQFNTERMVNIDNNVIGVECYKKKKEDVMVRISIDD